MILLSGKTSIAGVGAALLSIGIMTGAAQAACGSNSLGVSRTITIDTTGGKLYGGLQYSPGQLLKDREVILTFDDGPLRRHTRRVLKALTSHCTKATFFMVGRMAVADPAMVREVAAAGHTIASHTWSHKNLHKRSARRAGGEIELGISAVRIAAKTPISPFFRFPYLADPNSMIAYGKSRNLAIFSIDIDAYDYKTKSSERVYSNIMKQLRTRRKGIMLFHDIQRSTAGAMQRLLDTMQREGYKIVHVVSKTPVKTIADFDVQAQALHSKRRTVATASAISGGDYERAARSNRPRRKTSKGNTKVAAVKPPEPQTNPFSSSARKTAPRRRTHTRPKPDWRTSIWGN